MSVDQIAMSQTIAERLKRRLARLSQDLEPDEVPPAEAAQHQCLEKLAAAADSTPPGRVFPFPHIGTAGEGDLSCEWRANERIILLLIAPSGDMAMHQMEMAAGQVSVWQTVSQPTPEDVLAAVEWLAETDPSAR
jgi:hypothetical protein